MTMRFRVREKDTFNVAKVVTIRSRKKSERIYIGSKKKDMFIVRIRL